MFACLECGRKFKTMKAAEKAANDGCPKCGGVDIDLDMGDRLDKGYQEDPKPKFDEIGRPIEEATPEEIEAAYDRACPCLPEIEAAMKVWTDPEFDMDFPY